LNESKKNIENIERNFLCSDRLIGQIYENILGKIDENPKKLFFIVVLYWYIKIFSIKK
jgi:hypothetical protein